MSKANEPAFPQSDEPSKVPTYQMGLTKRELMAGLAMQGILAMHAHRELDPSEVKGKTIVTNAVTLADALLAELERVQ